MTKTIRHRCLWDFDTVDKWSDLLIYILIELEVFAHWGSVETDYTESECSLWTNTLAGVYISRSRRVYVRRAWVRHLTARRWSRCRNVSVPSERSKAKHGTRNVRCIGSSWLSVIWLGVITTASIATVASSPALTTTAAAAAAAVTSDVLCVKKWTMAVHKSPLSKSRVDWKRIDGQPKSQSSWTLNRIMKEVTRRDNDWQEKRPTYK